MAGDECSQITELLNEARRGENQVARDALARVLYDELRPMASGLLHRMFRRNPADGTNTPTGVINAAWMRLIRQRQQFDDRRHFFAIATLQLRRVIIDYWREWKARGGPKQRLHTDFGELKSAPASDGVECEGLFAALDELESLDPVEADVVRLRFMWNLTIAETAESLGVSHATVERRWKHARAWLRRKLDGEVQ